MKKNILFMLFGAIIATIVTVGVYAINANQIEYNDTTLDVVLDDLYQEVGKDILTRLNLSSAKVTSRAVGGNKGTRDVDLSLSKGKYLVIGTEATSLNNNNVAALESANTAYSKSTTSDGTCTLLKGIANTSIADQKIENNNQVLVMRSAIYICDLTTDGTVNVVTGSMSEVSTENTNLLVHAIKLD